jgi:hypothetical protein
MVDTPEDRFLSPSYFLHEELLTFNSYRRDGFI